MQLNIDLTSQERTALLRLARSAGKDVDQYLHDLVQIELHSEKNPPAELTKDQWHKELDECIALHPRVSNVDDSRDGNYGDHGR